MLYLAERPNRVDRGSPEVPRTVDDLITRFWGGATPSRARSIWQPVVDVIETPQAYLLRAEIAGVNPDDIEVTLVGDTLTMRGEKVIEERLDDQTTHLNERMAGRFERSFALPTSVSPKDIEAEARHGVLVIKVMKAKEAQPHKVAIRTS